MAKIGNDGRRRKANLDQPPLPATGEMCEISCMPMRCGLRNAGNVPETSFFCARVPLLAVHGHTPAFRLQRSRHSTPPFLLLAAVTTRRYSSWYSWHMLVFVLSEWCCDYLLAAEFRCNWLAGLALVLACIANVVETRPCASPFILFVSHRA